MIMDDYGWEGGLDQWLYNQIWNFCSIFFAFFVNFVQINVKIKKIIRMGSGQWLRKQGGRGGRTNDYKWLQREGKKSPKMIK